MPLEQTAQLPTHTRPNPFSSGKKFYFPIYKDCGVFLIGKGAFFCIAACPLANRCKSVPFPFCRITVPPPVGLGDSTGHQLKVRDALARWVGSCPARALRGGEACAALGHRSPPAHTPHTFILLKIY